MVRVCEYGKQLSRKVVRVLQSEWMVSWNGMLVETLAYPLYQQHEKCIVCLPSGCTSVPGFAGVGCRDWAA